MLRVSKHITKWKTGHLSLPGFCWSVLRKCFFDCFPTRSKTHKLDLLFNGSVISTRLFERMCKGKIMS